MEYFTSKTTELASVSQWIRLCLLLSAQHHSEQWRPTNPLQNVPCSGKDNPVSSFPKDGCNKATVGIPLMLSLCYVSQVCRVRRGSWVRNGALSLLVTIPPGHPASLTATEVRGQLQSLMKQPF